MPALHNRKPMAFVMTTYLHRRNGDFFNFDIAEITHILAYENQAMIMGKTGRLAQEYYRAFDNLRDGEALADYVAAAGRKLLPVNIRDQNNNYDVHHIEYIAPDSVSFITVSKPGDDGLQGVIINVHGGWRVTTYLPARELQPFLDAVKAACPQMLTFYPDEAYSRWIRPAALHIDPAAITRMNADNYQLRVQFHNTKGDLDIQAHNGEPAPDDRGPAVNAFAEKLFKATAGLTKLNGPRDFCAVQIKNIDIVDTDDIEPGSYSHTFFMRLCDKTNPLNPYKEAFNLYFKTAEERAGAIAQLKPTQPPQPRKKHGPRS
jgi:hypothetical protein